MNSLFDTIETWAEKPVKRNPKRGIEERPDHELNHKEKSTVGLTKVATTDGVYYVRPKNLEKFLSKIRGSQERLVEEESTRRQRWEDLEAASEPKVKVVIDKPKPVIEDYSDVHVEYFNTKDLRKKIPGMSIRELKAYLQFYRKRNNATPIKALKLRIEELQEAKS